MILQLFHVQKTYASPQNEAYVSSCPFLVLGTYKNPTSSPCFICPIHIYYR